MEDWILVYSNNNSIFFINENLSQKIRDKKIKENKKRNTIINAIQDNQERGKIPTTKY